MKQRALWHRLWHSPYLWRSSFYSGAQMAVQILLGMGQIWALANYLPRASYGIWGYCAGITGLVSIFTLPGMGQMITYGAARQMDGVLWAGVRIRLQFGVVASLLLLAIAAWHWQTEQRETAGMLLLAAFFLPAQLALDSMDAYLNGTGNFKALFWRRLLAQGTLAVAVALAAWYSRSLLLCALLLYGGGFLLSLLLFLSLLPQRRNRDLPENFLSLSRQFSLQSIGNTIGYNMERPLLARFISFEEMAAYNLALAAQLAVGMGRLVDRILISRLADPSRGVTITQVRWGMQVLFVLGGLGYLVLLFLLQQLLPLLLPHYVDALPIMAILLLQMPFTWSTSLGLSWLLARPEHHPYYHRVTWLIMVARILLLSAGAVLAGSQGLAWAWVVLECGQFFMVFHLVRSDQTLSQPSSPP
ncbi:MAG: oligosaccharide flippase family protein [Magnetococcales bacterium]|nr:oligosaccharide flippase family protein [Magnetococcales bacterium]MBF0114271.1 oligosaccharide flippase family protein [Magnetococcales bacterium]